MRARRAEERGKRGGSPSSAPRDNQGRVLVGSPDSLDATRCDLVAHPRRRTRRETPTRDAHAKCSFTPSRARTPPPRTPTTTTNNQSINQINARERAIPVDASETRARFYESPTHERTPPHARTHTNERRRTRASEYTVVVVVLDARVASTSVAIVINRPVDDPSIFAKKQNPYACVSNTHACVQPTAPTPIDQSRP